MKSSRLLLATVILATMGCVAQPTPSPLEPLPEIPDFPSAEWVDEHLPLFRQVVEDNPSVANKKALAYLEAHAITLEKAATRAAQIDRQLTLAWDNRGRGGAAMRQPAYIHVLHDPFNDTYTNLPDAIADRVDGLDRDEVQRALDALADLHQEQRDRRGYSIYEMKRWERYCDGGKGMDEPDWQFVTREGAPHDIPDLLLTSCTPPSFDYSDYLSAWTRFCEADSPTRADRDIVRNTVRPRTVANPCRAL